MTSLGKIFSVTIQIFSAIFKASSWEKKFGMHYRSLHIMVNPDFTRIWVRLRLMYKPLSINLTN